jgi:hypothetical protein
MTDLERAISDVEQAIADVEAGRAQRIAVPGKWRVWREGNRVCVEMLGVK